MTLLTNTSKHRRMFELKFDFWNDRSV